MKKILVTVENMETYICANKFYHTKALILTSEVKDLCAKRKIEIVYGAQVNSCTPPQEACHSLSCQPSSFQSSSCQSNGSQASFPQVSPLQAKANYDLHMQGLLHDASTPKQGSCCAGISNDPFEQMLVKLALTIREMYGITDLVQLRELSMEAAKIIKKNL